MSLNSLFIEALRQLSPEELANIYNQRAVRENSNFRACAKCGRLFTDIEHRCVKAEDERANQSQNDCLKMRRVSH